MKIYVLPVSSAVQEPRQKFLYPPHNEDYGVEQDFHVYLMKSGLLTNNKDEADWHYLPVYWTRWHLNHDYGREGREELQGQVDKALLADQRTFTICQYDDGPLVSLGDTVQFLASRKTDRGIDIPLLSSPHRLPFLRVKKRYRASFVGRVDTHEIRKKMQNEVGSRGDVLFIDGNRGSKFFVRSTLQSHVALSPRGYGGSSFRTFEAMQLGVAPLIVGDRDTRPFRRFIPWETFTFFTSDPAAIGRILDDVADEEALLMGKRCAEVWRDHLAFQKWCPYVLRELECLR